MIRMEKHTFSATVILADADYLDNMVGGYSAFFAERIGRRLPQADLAQWCITSALDGGLEDGDNEVQVVLIHSKDKSMLDNFCPGLLAETIDGQAFRDERLGEFLLSCVPDEQVDQEAEPFFLQCARMLLDCKEVKRLVLVPDDAVCQPLLEPLLQETPQGKRVTLLVANTQDKLPHCNVVNLGFGIMHAVGIKADELR